jgi:glycosyltransferase involved in cell wall biosynthesis
VKVLQIYKDIHPMVTGGIERYIYDLGTFLVSRGHHSSVLVTTDGRDSPSTAIIDGIDVMFARCIGRILSNPLCPGLGRLISRSDADILHFHLPLPAAVLGWLFSRSYGSRPYVITYHSDIVRQAFLMPVYGPFLRKFLSGADRIFATSPVYAETSKWIKGLMNVRVIPIGTDPERWVPGDPSEREGYFLFVGRFRKYKGIDVLLDAWASLPDQKLVMVGGGPLLRMVMHRVKSENLSVEVVSDVSDSDLMGFYRKARALVLPSTMRSEAFGMVQVESMACGTPVISTALQTGVPWVNADSVSGMVVDPCNPEAIVTAVRQMLDSDTWERLAAGARHRALSIFDGPALLQKVEQNYSEVLTEWDDEN